MSLMEFVRASSASSALLGRFCCANEATQAEADEQKNNTIALFNQYHYKREVYGKRTV